MRNFHTLLPGFLSGILTAVLGPTVAWAAPMTTTPYSISSGDVVVGAATFHVHYLTYQNGAYVSETDFARVLNQFGLNAGLTGDALNARWLGPYHAKSDARIQGTRLLNNGSFTIHGTVYANLSRVARLNHWKLSYHGVTGTLAVKATSRQQSMSGTDAPNTVASMVQNGQRMSADGQHITSWASFQGVQAKVVHAGQSEYIGVWYVVRILRLEGYHASFARHRLVIGQLPTVVSGGALEMGATTDPTTLIRYHSAWYVPLSAFVQVFGEVAATDKRGSVQVSLQPIARVAAPNPGLQGQFTVSLTVKGVASSTTQSANVTGGTPSMATPAAPGGSTRTVSFLLADGSVLSVPLKDTTTKVSLPGPDAILMGYSSNAEGWIGVGEIVGSGATSVVLPGSVQQGGFTGQIHTDVPTGATVVIRDEVTHQEYTFDVHAAGRYQGTLPYGVYTVWALRSGGTSRYIGSRFVIGQSSTTLGRITLPDVSQKRMISSAHCIAVAENKDVTGAELDNAVRIFDATYGADVQRFQMNVRVPVVIEVFGSQSEFTQHFLDEAYSDSVSGAYGADAQAVTEGSRVIAINAADMTLDNEVNVLAHEFTHVILQQNLQTVPLWLNEGLAWAQGLRVQAAYTPSPLLTQALQWNLWESPVSAALSGQLTSFLTASTVSTAYNVEAEDNFAVANLIGAAGWSNTIKFLKEVSTLGERAAFQSVFHESEDTFVSDVEKELLADATAGPVSMNVTVRTSDTFSGEVFISNPAGKTFVYAGAVPNQTYQFGLSKSGTVTVPPSLVQVGTTASPVDGYWDVGVENGDTQAFFSISANDGIGHLVTTNVFSGTSNVPAVRLETALPLGLALVAIH